MDGRCEVCGLIEMLCLEMLTDHASCHMKLCNDNHSLSIAKLLLTSLLLTWRSVICSTSGCYLREMNSEHTSC